jgi:hypothetical protein
MLCGEINASWEINKASTFSHLLLFGKKKTNIMLWVGTDFLFFVGRGCGMK